MQAKISTDTHTHRSLEILVYSNKSICGLIQWQYNEMAAEPIPTQKKIELILEMCIRFLSMCVYMREYVRTCYLSVCIIKAVETNDVEFLRCHILQVCAYVCVCVSLYVVIKLYAVPMTLNERRWLSGITESERQLSAKTTTASASTGGKLSSLSKAANWNSK